MPAAASVSSAQIWVEDEAAAPLEFSREAFDASPVAMTITSLDASYMRVNDAACRLLGRSRQELLRLHVTEILHPDDVTISLHRDSLMAVAAARNLTLERRYLRPEGTTVWTSVFLTPIRDRSGETCAFLAQIIDLTHVRRREMELAQEVEDLGRLREVRRALAEERLLLYAQPIIDLRSGDVIQQELLVRLQRPDGEIMPPSWFLPVAERFGLIREIDRWVSGRAIEMAAAGQSVEVNLSAHSLGDAGLLGMLHRELCRREVDPSHLVFEITETAMIDDLERGRAFAQTLRQLGCGFALDDFGTGWGSLTALKHIPVDYLKIDRQFVCDLSRSDTDARLVRTIVALAQEFGQQTVAEGVEDAATLEQLRALGVDHAQGFHLGRPQALEPLCIAT